MQKPFTRKDLESGQFNIIAKGRWGNADLYKFHRNGKTWVVKDFSPCPPFIRKTWGRLEVKGSHCQKEIYHQLKQYPNPGTADGAEMHHQV